MASICRRKRNGIKYNINMRKLHSIKKTNNNKLHINDGITIYDEYRDITKKILDKNKKDESKNKLYEKFDYGLSDW